MIAAMVLTYWLSAFATPSAECDAVLTIAKASFSSSVAVRFEMTSPTLTEVFVEDGIRVQRLVSGHWIGPKLREGLSAISKVRLDEGGVAGPLWRDVAIDESESRFRVEAGTYRFYVAYSVSTVKGVGRKWRCVALSDSFELRESNSWTGFNSRQERSPDYPGDHIW